MVDDNEEQEIEEEEIEPSDEEDVGEDIPVPEPSAVPAKETKQTIVDDPYEWDKCQITLTITYFPDDGDQQGRMVVFTGRTHMDAPVIHYFREGEVSNTEAMLGIIGEIQAELMATLEDRGQAYQKIKTKQAEEAAKRPAVTHISSSSRPVTPAFPQYPAELLTNNDALTEMNVSVVALKMLQELVRYEKRDYKMFKKSWKDQAVLELLVFQWIQIKDTDVVLTEKGKAVYDRAMAWKPTPKPKTEDPKPVVREAPKQASLF